MSIRTSRRPDTPVPIVGAAVGSPAGGFWSRLLVGTTPPSTPPSAPTAAPSISSSALGRARGRAQTARGRADADADAEQGGGRGAANAHMASSQAILYELPKCSCDDVPAGGATRCRYAEFPRRVLAEGRLGRRHSGGRGRGRRGPRWKRTGGGGGPRLQPLQRGARGVQGRGDAARRRAGARGRGAGELQPLAGCRGLCTSVQACSFSESRRNTWRRCARCTPSSRQTRNLATHRPMSWC